MRVTQAESTDQLLNLWREAETRSQRHHVGYDADGNPTLVVVDFLLLHLGWPGV